jgi:hypothetical protein
MQAQLDLFQNRFSETPVELFDRLYREMAIRSRRSSFRWPARVPVSLSFKPYANANSRIQLIDGQLNVRLSDIWEEAPRDVLEALATILLSKLFRRAAPVEAQEIYSRWISQPELRDHISHLRRTRGRKHLSSPEGRAYHLGEMFDRINEEYFGGSLQRPALGWSRTVSRTLLGHFDPSHNAIVLSKLLDQAEVPAIAVEFVLYHEMLHMQYPCEVRDGRRKIHTREFRKAEKRFAQYAEAKAALKRICLGTYC